MGATFGEKRAHFKISEQFRARERPMMTSDPFRVQRLCGWVCLILQWIKLLSKRIFRYRKLFDQHVHQCPAPCVERFDTVFLLGSITRVGWHRHLVWYDNLAYKWAMCMYLVHPAFDVHTKRYMIQIHEKLPDNERSSVTRRSVILQKNQKRTAALQQPIIRVHQSRY